MAYRVHICLKVNAAATLLALTWGPNFLLAQSSVGGAKASTQDTQFLKDLAQDSNFEIGTSKLALKNSQSADVKQYAAMVIHDHELLKQKISSADRAAKQSTVDSSSMTSEDQAEYDKLKTLNGKDFDQAFIQQLIKGNDHIQKEEKAESSDSTLPAVKNLATQSVATDTKHSNRAKQLAKAHNVQS